MARRPSLRCVKAICKMLLWLSSLASGSWVWLRSLYMPFHVALIKSQHPLGRIVALLVSKERRILEIVGEMVRCCNLVINSKMISQVGLRVLQQARWRRVSFCLPQALHRLLVYLVG